MSPEDADLPGDPISPARLTRRAYFERLVEEAPFAVVSIDTEGTVVYANMGVRRIFGYEPSAVEGRPLTDLVPERLREQHRSGFAAYLETGERHVDWEYVELTGLHADGHEVPLAVTLREVEVGEETLYTGLVHERETGADTGAGVPDELEEVASILSHDLRNPLNVATGYLALEAESNDSEHVARALSALDRMEHMVEDLLSLVRDGRVVTETRPTEFEAAAREAWGRFADADATFEVADGGRLVADPARLRTLLEHVLENAVVHSPPGVTVTVGTTDDGFYVADDGPGIRPVERGSVTEPGHTTVSSRPGLGLAIVDRIAAAHGWSFEVTGSEDGGARVEFHGVDRAP
jgi:PAS domain S-box-containing protein